MEINDLKEKIIASLHLRNCTVNVDENNYDSIFSFNCNYLELPRNEEEFSELFNFINSRDAFTIKADIVDTVYNGNNYEIFKREIDNFDSNEDGQIKLTLKIKKNISNNVQSVYSVEDFINYIISLEIAGLFNYINSFNRSKSICFQSQLDECVFESSLVKFNVNPIDSNDSSRAIKYEAIKNVCYCPLFQKSRLIPEDFKIINRDSKEELNIYFEKIQKLLCLGLLFDYLEVDRDNISYYLKGDIAYKETVSFKASFNANSHIDFYNVYSWVFNQNELTNKLSIARIVISHYFIKDSIALQIGIMDGIYSNYEMQLKSNLSIYVDAKKQLTSCLVDAQKNGESLLKTFLEDFKKMLLASMSFLIASVIFKVMNKNEFVNCFSWDITIITTCFLIISGGLVFLSYGREYKQINRLKKSLDGLKIGYQHILSNSEIETLCEKFCSPDSYIKILKNDRNLFMLYLIMIFISIVILTCINEYNVIKFLIEKQKELIDYVIQRIY